MPIDSRIPLQGRVPQISLQPLMEALAFSDRRKAGQLQRESNLFNMAQAKAQQEAKKRSNDTFKQLLESNIELTPDGQSVNKQGLISGLIGSGDPELFKIGGKLELEHNKEQRQKQTDFMNKNAMLLKAKGDMFKNLSPYLKALTDPIERANILKEEHKKWKLPTDNLPDSIDDTMLATLGQQLSPVKQQIRVDKDNYFRTFNPSSGVLSYATGPKGAKVQSQENITYKTDESGKLVPLSSKTAPTTAPKPIPGFTAKGTAKLRLDEKKTDLAIKQADFNLNKAVELAKHGGQFKTTQYDAAGYGLRMEEVESGLDRLFKSKSFDPTTLSFAIMEAGPEMLKSGPMKSYLQYQQNFINATLREESGAAIAEDEFIKAQKLYFPQVGDTSENLRQKKRARALKQSGYMTEASGAWHESKASLEKIINPKPINARPLKRKPKVKYKNIENMNESQLDAEIRALQGGG